MAQPVLVRSYTSPKPTPFGSPGGRSHVLPPIAAFSFADILRAADSAELQSAIDGIAEICAKNHMSLAEEYGSHLPPVGEITAISRDSTPVRQPFGRTNMRRALTSVPEASSGSSDGSIKGRSRGILGFRPKQEVVRESMRTIRISSIGRTIPVCGTTAVSMGAPEDHASFRVVSYGDDQPTQTMPISANRATSSLQHLIAAYQPRAA
ncbi:hypothetical protein Q7P35_004203 [Cladosporium inversicolor]